MSRNPNFPLSRRKTETSATAPMLRCPSSVRLICFAGSQVDLRTTSLSGRPSARNFDMTLVMFFMPPFMLRKCRSVEMESAMKPFFTEGTALEPPEAACAVAHIELDSPFLCFKEIGSRLAPAHRAGAPGRDRYAYTCRRARSFFVTSSSKGRSLRKEPKSTITGMSAFVPASTARSTGIHSVLL